jgi:orotate phosphoribosyltransferase
MTPEQAEALLQGAGAMLTGHFLLSSGRHSDRYVEKARILERPAAVMALAEEMASWHQGVETVVSPAVGAIVLGFAVALRAGARFVFAERDQGRMSLRRGFSIRRGERVLVVEDVITTGGSARQVHDLLGAAGAERLGVAAMVDRSQDDVGLPLRAVLRVQAVSWDPADCPLCRQGLPIDAPGSKYLAPGAETSPSSRG